MIFRGYKASKLKPQLKMAVTRFQMSGNKKSAITKQQIREIAMLLADNPPKEENARIKAEALIRDDNTVEAYEILQLNCELLSERIHLISHSKECPPDLVSCVSTIIWASAIVDIPELIEIRKQFRYKYGKEFDCHAMQNVGGVLNERVAARLSVQPPSAYLVQTYLEKIADEHEVNWKPKVTSKPAPYNPEPIDISKQMAALREQHPVLPTPSSQNVPPSEIEEIEEVDIYVVPGVPKFPGVNGHNKNNNDEEGDGGGGEQQANRDRTHCARGGLRGSAPSVDGGDEDHSHDDLVAMFAMLQKL